MIETGNSERSFVQARQDLRSFVDRQELTEMPNHFF